MGWGKGAVDRGEKSLKLAVHLSACKSKSAFCSYLKIKPNVLSKLANVLNIGCIAFALWVT